MAKAKKAKIKEDPTVDLVIEEPVEEVVAIEEEPVVEEIVEPIVEEPVIAEEPPPVLEPPSPVDRGELYVESHPILGVTRRATVVSNSIGDGRVGDGAEIVRS